MTTGIDDSATDSLAAAYRALCRHGDADLDVPGVAVPTDGD